MRTRWATTDLLELRTPERFTVRNQEPAVGRNARCPAAGGRKYEHCCMRAASLTQDVPTHGR